MSEEQGLEDDMLIQRACQGDMNAYESLVQRHQDLAFRTAYVITRDAHAAEDAAQEAFLRAYRALPRFRLGSPFRPWLLKIVSNEAKRRQAAAIRQHNLALEASHRYEHGKAPSVESTVLDLELRNQLQGAIGGLSDTDRLVITYRFVLGLSEAEMAAAMNCRQGTVKSRLSRALGRLKSRLAIHYPELMPGGADA